MKDDQFVQSVRRKNLTRRAQAHGIPTMVCPTCKGRRHVEGGAMGWVDCTTCGAYGCVPEDVVLDVADRLGGTKGAEEYLDTLDSLERLGGALTGEEAQE
jgi:hypothetical protein